MPGRSWSSLGEPTSRYTPDAPAPCADVWLQPNTCTARLDSTARRFPRPQCPSKVNTESNISSTCIAGPRRGSITLVTLGPLTNIAMALVEAPDIAPRLREIVAVLGSWSENGNITPAAAFNEYVDPEAADVVLTSGVPLTMVPMDVTHQCLSTPSRLAALRTNGNACSVAAADMLAFSEAFDMAKYGWEGAPLHDPCAIAYLIDPAMFGGRKVNVVVETAGLHTSGMTVVDWWSVTDREPNAYFLREIDVAQFYALLKERLERLP